MLMAGLSVAVADICSNNEWPPSKQGPIARHIDVKSTTFTGIFVEAPLSGLIYHAAIVLQGNVQEEVWTVEFETRNLGSALFPSVVNGTLNSTPDNPAFSAGYCIRKGVLHGKSYWTTWQPVAIGFHWSKMDSLVYGLLIAGSSTYEYSYSTFYVQNLASEQRAVTPVSSGEGALGIVDYLHNIGARLHNITSAADLPITTVRINSTDISECDMKDEERQREVLSFFTKLQADFGNSTAQRLEAVANYLRAPGQAFVYYRSYWDPPESHNGKFFAINGERSLSVEHAPRKDWKYKYGPPNQHA